MGASDPRSTPRAFLFFGALATASPLQQLPGPRESDRSKQRSNHAPGRIGGTRIARIPIAPSPMEL